MSQIYKPLSSSGPIPPNIPTSFVTDSGTAVPAANILNVLTNDTTVNNDNGIQDTGSGSTVTILLTNRLQGLGSTIGATTADLFTFAMGATPGVFLFQVGVAAFDAITPNAAGYETYTTVRTNGVNATIIGDTDSIIHETAGFATTLAQIVVSGNNVIYRVTGVAGLTISWSAVGTYIRAV